MSDWTPLTSQDESKLPELQKVKQYVGWKETKKASPVVSATRLTHFTPQPIPTCIFGKSWVAQTVWTILLSPEESHLWCWDLLVTETHGWLVQALPETLRFVQQVVYRIWTPRSWWCVWTWRRCTWSSAGGRQAWWWASGGICQRGSPRNTVHRLVSAAVEPQSNPHMEKHHEPTAHAHRASRFIQPSSFPHLHFFLKWRKKRGIEETG